MRDLSDPYEADRRQQADVRRQKASTMLQNSSITQGGLRVASANGILAQSVAGGNPAVRVTGLQVVDGVLRITGTLEGSGSWSWTGPWTLSGDGEITGDVDLAGNFDLTGVFESGNVRIEGGKIYVGTGSNLIVIDGATGTITVGDMVLDPSNHNGMITMPNDAQVLGFESNLELYGPPAAGGRNGVIIKPDEIMIAKLPVATSTTGLRWVAADILGNLCVVPPNIGGPMGGPLRWPFPPSTVSSEYGPRESPGPGGSTFHEGMDFAPGEGMPIPAAASGTVELAGTNGGFGNCVIINHGNGLKTLYGHMQSTPSVTVGQQVSAGQIIGAVGNTGVSFGAHLHFEVHVNGAPVNPRTKLPQN